MDDDAASLSRERKLLMQRVADLGPTEHEEIFNMLREEGVEYMENNNGFFINLSTVGNDLLRKISAFVSFCMANKNSLDEYDKNLNECKLGLGLTKDADAAAVSVSQPSQPGQPGQPGQPERPTEDQHAAPPFNNEMAASSVASAQHEHAKYTQARKKFAKRKVHEKKAGRETWVGVGHDAHASPAVLSPEAFPIPSVDSAQY